ncbi:MAG: sulfotransferase [Myxococcota bacterium]|nr:sulfotransferase [Myxococcota bacterium]
MSPSLQGIAPVTAMVGNGRSGSNWLLGILDASALTHCRSEPEDIPGSPIHGLPRPSAKDLDPELGPAWARFVRWTRTTVGERDHPPAVDKAYYRSLANRLGLAAMHRRPGLNRLKRRLLGPLYRAERAPSRLLVSPRRLREAPCIMKLNDFHAAHVKAVLALDPELRVIHLVRHPGGFLDSALRRFFGALSEAELAEEKARYRRLLEEGRRAGVYAEDVLEGVGEELVAVVMRFWSANNQAIAEIAGAMPRYMRVLYEEMAARPLAAAAAVYAHVGLPFDDEQRARIEQLSGENVWGDLAGSPVDVSRRWRERLGTAHRNLVDRELARTSMAAWWPAG